MEKNKIDLGIGYVYIQQLRKGVTNIDEIASAFQEKRIAMERGNGYCYDRFTQIGSNSQGVIVDENGSNKEKIIWCINHYLGLNRHPEVIRAATEATEIYGTGSGTSAMSGGRNSLHFQIEKRLSSLLSKESILLFPTGYSANLGAISGLVQKEDIIISDEESHASIIDGIKLSNRKKILFKHNDVEDLEKKLEAFKYTDGNIFVIVESAYSMSGDLSPLKKIVELKRKYNFYLYLDEAHSFGFYGRNGAGYAESLGVLGEIDFFVSTLSKSCASIGGFIALKEKFRTMLMCRASPYIFQACFTPSNAATILAALNIIEREPDIAKSLHEKNKYMRSELLNLGFNLGKSQSPIIPIFIPEFEILKPFEKEMFEMGVFAVLVAFPAVSPLEGRIRLILNASHSYSQIDKTISVLRYLGRKYGII